MQSSRYQYRNDTSQVSYSIQYIAYEFTEILIWHFYQVRKVRLSPPLAQQIKQTYMQALHQFDLTNNALVILCTFNYFVRLEEQIPLGASENFDRRCLELLLMAINLTYKYLEDDEANWALKRWQEYFPKKPAITDPNKLLFPSIKQLNKLEAEMLKKLNYRLHLRGSIEHFHQLLSAIIATKNMFYELVNEQFQKSQQSKQKKMYTQYKEWCETNYKSLKELTSETQELNAEKYDAKKLTTKKSSKHGDVSAIAHQIKKIQL